MGAKQETGNAAERRIGGKIASIVLLLIGLALIVGGSLFIRAGRQAGKKSSAETAEAKAWVSAVDAFDRTDDDGRTTTNYTVHWDWIDPDGKEHGYTERYKDEKYAPARVGETQTIGIYRASNGSWRRGDGETSLRGALGMVMAALGLIVLFVTYLVGSAAWVKPKSNKQEEKP